MKKLTFHSLTFTPLLTQFKNILAKGKIANNEQFLIFALTLSTLSKDYTFIFRDFTPVSTDVSKVACWCRFVVCRKGFIDINTILKQEDKEDCIAPLPLGKNKITGAIFGKINPRQQRIISTKWKFFMNNSIII